MAEDLAIDVGLQLDSDDYKTFVACVNGIMEQGCGYSDRTMKSIKEYCGESELPFAKKVIHEMDRIQNNTSRIRPSKMKWRQTYRTRRERQQRDRRDDRRRRDPPRKEPRRRQRQKRPMSPLFEQKRKRPMSPLFDQKRKRPMSPMYEQSRKRPMSPMYEESRKRPMSPTPYDSTSSRYDAVPRWPSAKRRRY